MLGLLSVPLFGQAANSPVIFDAKAPIVTTFVKPPSLGNTIPGSSSDDAQWLRVEFHYSVLPAEGKFVDSIEFRIWIEGADLMAKEAGKEGSPVALTGSVTYVNVPLDKDLFGVFYLHPATLARYSTSTGISDFDKKFDIHLEAYVGGALMDQIDKKKGEKPDWFKQPRAVPDLVYRQDQSPFLLADITRYPEMKLTGSGSGSSSESSPAPEPAPPPAPTPETSPATAVETAPTSVPPAP